MSTLLLVSCQSLPWNRNGYDVEFSGINNKAELRNLRALSEAWQYRSDPEIDVSRLDNLFRGDTFMMTRYLQANGRSGAFVSSSVDTNGRRPRITFTVEGTNIYLVRDIQLSIVDGVNVSVLGWTNTLSGQRADFAAIDQTARTLVRTLRNSGHPFASVENRSALVDHDNQAVDLVFELRAGMPAVMGTNHVEGLRRVDRNFVERRINWKPGEPFRQDTLDEFSQRLTGSSLFSFVDISGSPAAATSGVFDVNVKLQERRRRTIGLGIGYQSDLGPEGTVFWQHRNLFGMGERVEVDARYSEDLWVGSIVLTLPDIFHSSNDLDLGVRVSEEDSDAYDTRYQSVFGTLHHRIHRDLTLLYGPALRNSTVTQREIENDYLQASFPAHVIWNKRDNNLDPMRGYAVNVFAEPYYDINDAVTFTKALVTPAVFIPIVPEILSLGARVTVGTIFGTSAANVPADLRFYSGGGQSIRGYEYQSVGPRDEEGRLIGGKSLVESSFELRWRFTKSLGLVAFLDGGTSYEPEFSDFSESYQWGAGLGFRYFTGVGPIRLDFGVPVNPRDDIDNDFEFYISIGQAF